MVKRMTQMELYDRGHVFHLVVVVKLNPFVANAIPPDLPRSVILSAHTSNPTPPTPALHYQSLSLLLQLLSYITTLSDGSLFTYFH